MTVYNINDGHNADIAARCETLKQYSAFVAKAREFGAEKTWRGKSKSTLRRRQKEAITKAVEWCIAHDILKEFLTIHSTEVINMLTRELTIEDILEVQVRDAREMAREEGLEQGWEEGLEQGLERGRAENTIESVKNLFDFGMTAEQISRALKLPLETVLRYE